VPAPSHPLYPAYRKYINSPLWTQLKLTMPGPRECLACGSIDNLDLHHMFYPPNIFDTKHCHCCWLCRKCHELFHKRTNSPIPLKNGHWGKLRGDTKRMITKTEKKRRIRWPKGPCLR
jgi:hypothetical protein